MYVLVSLSVMFAAAEYASGTYPPEVDRQAAILILRGCRSVPIAFAAE
jgi:hypothetical protein